MNGLPASSRIATSGAVQEKTKNSVWLIYVGARLLKISLQLCVSIILKFKKVHIIYWNVFLKYIQLIISINNPQWFRVQICDKTDQLHQYIDIELNQVGTSLCTSYCAFWQKEATKVKYVCEVLTERTRLSWEVKTT